MSNAALELGEQQANNGETVPLCPQLDTRLSTAGGCWPVAV